MDPISARMVMAAAGAGAAGSEVYVEDVFSTFLYEGNGTSQTITNGIDLAGEGGMVWFKRRDASSNHMIQNTERGVNFGLIPNSDSNEQDTQIGGVPFNISAFNSDGFDVAYGSLVNSNGGDYASWTFRKAPGFFDVVTYTGDSNTSKTIAHNLGSAPGMIWVKNLSSINSWHVYHRSQGATKVAFLDLPDSFAVSSNRWNDTEPTATEFTVGSAAGVNNNGNNYVAYLFAHDDARFGPDADESIIKCGTYTGNGSSDGPVIDLGWEPQCLLIKRATGFGNGQWMMFDTARGIVYDDSDNYLQANSSATEAAAQYINFLPTGFELKSTVTDVNNAGNEYVYTAIRRPDKAPTTASDFFQVRTRAGTGAIGNSSIDFNADLSIVKRRAGGVGSWITSGRGFTDFAYLATNSNSSQTVNTNYLCTRGDIDSTIQLGSNANVNKSATDYADYFWKRARGAFDIVYYTGDGSPRTIAHGLGVAPEMMWVKNLAGARNWTIYSSGFPNPTTEILSFGTSSIDTTADAWNSASPTATEFSLGNYININRSGNAHVAFLFANVPGVLDMGSYTGTGVAGLQIDCGFTAGARFVLIKVIDISGYEWKVYDTARGIIASSSPLLEFSNDAAEVSGTDLEPYAPGFQIDSTAIDLNSVNGTYIYMAIA